MTPVAQMYASRDDDFGNGRLGRTVFEQTIEHQAERLMDDPAASTRIITRADVLRLRTETA